MPYAIILIGAVLLVSGIRGTYSDLWQLVRGDFSGTDSYLAWVAAIAVIGGIGYVPKLKPLSVALLTLLLIVLVLTREKGGGVFEKLQAYIQAGIPGSAGNKTAVNSLPEPSTEQLSDAATIALNLGAGLG